MIHHFMDTEFVKIMNWRMAIKKSSSQFDITELCHFLERAFLDRVGFCTVGCSIFKTEVIGSSCSSETEDSFELL